MEAFKKFKPRKSFSQNFLKDAQILNLIASHVNAGKQDAIIEIGPGQGQLTDYLLNSGAVVFGVEIDQKLGGFLKKRYLNQPNFKLVNQDALKIDITALVNNSHFKNWYIVSNLPYHIVSPLFFKILRLRGLFKQILILVQKEFALRITSTIGQRPKKNLSSISVASHIAFESTLLYDIDPEFFEPVPKVRSSLVELKPKAYYLDGKTEAKFIKFARKIYLNRRKTLLNSLKINYANHPALLKATHQQDLMQKRPEDLTFEQWQALFNLFK